MKADGIAWLGCLLVVTYTKYTRLLSFVTNAHRSTKHFVLSCVWIKVSDQFSHGSRFMKTPKWKE